MRFKKYWWAYLLGGAVIWYYYPSIPFTNTNWPWRSNG
jgi:hypothetical protein